MANLDLYTLIRVFEEYERIENTVDDSGEALFALRNWLRSEIDKQKQFLLANEEREA